MGCLIVFLAAALAASIQVNAHSGELNEDSDLLERMVLRQRANYDLARRRHDQPELMLQESVHTGQLLGLMGPKQIYAPPRLDNSYQPRRFVVERVQPRLSHSMEPMTGPLPKAQTVPPALAESMGRLLESTGKEEGADVTDKMKELSDSYDLLRRKIQQKLARMKAMRAGRRMASQREIEQMTQYKPIVAAYASKTAVSVDPLFVDLDNFEGFSDISYHDISDPEALTTVHAAQNTRQTDQTTIQTDQTTQIHNQFTTTTHPTTTTSPITRAPSTKRKVISNDQTTTNRRQTTTTPRPSTQTTTTPMTSITPVPLHFKQQTTKEDQTSRNRPVEFTFGRDNIVSEENTDVGTTVSPPVYQKWTILSTSTFETTPTTQKSTTSEPIIATEVKSSEAERETPIIEDVGSRERMEIDDSSEDTTTETTDDQTTTEESSEETTKESEQTTSTMNPLWWTPKPSFLGFSSMDGIVPPRPLPQRPIAETIGAEKMGRLPPGVLFESEASLMPLAPRPQSKMISFVTETPPTSRPTPPTEHQLFSSQDRFGLQTNEVLIEQYAASTTTERPQLLPFRHDNQKFFINSPAALPVLPPSPQYQPFNLEKNREAERNTYTTRLPAKIHRVAEQTVLNELEVLASSVNLDDLSRELREDSKDVATEAKDWDLERVERELASKRRALQQLELLNELEEIGDNQENERVEAERRARGRDERWRHLQGSRTQQLNVPQPNSEISKKRNKAAVSSPAASAAVDIAAVDDALSQIRFFEDKEETEPGTTTTRGTPAAKWVPVVTLDSDSEYRRERLKKSDQDERVDSDINFERPASEVRTRGESGEKKRSHGRSKIAKPKGNFKRFVAPPPSQPKRAPPPPPTDKELESVNRLYQLLEAEVKNTASIRANEQELCERIVCTFEKGNTCNFETSFDEIALTIAEEERRKRSAERDSVPVFTMRSWSNWIGAHNRTTARIDRAPIFSLENHRFAGVVLDGKQMATMTVKIPSQSPFAVRFRAFEASRGLRFRVCCDDWCSLTTEDGLRRGSKNWRRMTAHCPSETNTLSFECVNSGAARGACGVDDVFLESPECPALFTQPDST